jgi:hypothetical protein
VGAASSRDYAIMAMERFFFRGWKPLRRDMDVELMTLIHDFLEFQRAPPLVKKTDSLIEKET